MAVDKIQAVRQLETTPQNVSVPNATVTDLASLILEPGTWLVIGSHQYNADTSTTYVDYFSVNGSAASADAQRASMSGGGGASLIRVYSFTSSTTVGYLTNQFTGQTRTANYIKLQALKLA